jgi:non-ribosomal peptide synthetase component F
MPLPEWIILPTYLLKNTITQLGSHLYICRSSEIKWYYSEIKFARRKEYKQIVHDWDATEKVRIKTIHQLFEEQITKTPDAIALAYGSQKLSYKELNEKRP